MVKQPEFPDWFDKFMDYATPVFLYGLVIPLLLCVLWPFFLIGKAFNWSLSKMIEDEQKGYPPK